VTPPSQKPVIIINSGSYSDPELSAEFGPLPPAFLPVGLGRLYEKQIQSLSKLRGELCLTLPESFELPSWDADKLRTLGATVIRTPDGLSLGAALLYVLGSLGFQDRPLRILHGDTLVESLDLHLDDRVAVAHGSDGYRWGWVRLGRDDRIEEFAPPALADNKWFGPRLCGYFSFASTTHFAEQLALTGGDFFASLNRYAASNDLRTVTPEQWLDFGHVQTFFRSRRTVTTQRAFNSLEIGDMHVRKRSSTEGDKLRAEARWLREVPPSIGRHCIRVLEEGDDSDGYYYDTEYEFMPTLAELHVFGRTSWPSWKRILDACERFVTDSIEAANRLEHKEASGTLHRLVVDKTIDRLDTLAKQSNIDLDAPNTLNGRPMPSFRQCVDDITTVLTNSGDCPSVMHGDFCFSNILYNNRSERIRLIDPRGMNERGEFSLYGDVRYDLAKLMHSLCGRYDLIVAGCFAGKRVGTNAFELTFPTGARRSMIEEMAKAHTMAGHQLNSTVIWAAMTSLFLSMPPLHADRPERQSALMANALRLHAEMENAS